MVREGTSVPRAMVRSGKGCGHSPPPCTLAGVFSIRRSNLKAQMGQMCFCTAPGGRGMGEMCSWRSPAQAPSLAGMGVLGRAWAVGSSVSPSLLPQSPGATSSQWPAQPRRAGEGACPPPSLGARRCPPGTAPSPTPSLPPARSPPAAPFTAWTGKGVGAGPGGWWGRGRTLPGAQACSHFEIAFARTPISPRRV